jgi:acetoin utilization deacetylase AcuC-like enzyme
MIARLYSEAFLTHGVSWHPENADRLRAIVRRLTDSGLWHELAPLEFEAAAWERLLWVHEEWYLEDLEAASRGGGEVFDPDTIATEHTWEAAQLAAGACMAAAEAVVSSAGLQAVCLVRPPGHHALPGRAMGFCFLNNGALAAEAARRAGAARVAIFDFDCHHGNGLQEIFYPRGDVLYVSVHEREIFPGSGTVDELGIDAGFGLNVNVPLPAGARGRHYLRAWDELIEPVIRRFQPDLLLLEAGYDAHWRDPLTSMGLEAGDYYDLVRRARILADAVCEGRVQVILEGGYDSAALALCVEDTVLALLGESVQEQDQPPPEAHPGQRARVEEYLEAALRTHRGRLGV